MMCAVFAQLRPRLLSGTRNVLPGGNRSPRRARYSLRRFAQKFLACFNRDESTLGSFWVFLDVKLHKSSALVSEESIKTHFGVS